MPSSVTTRQVAFEPGDAMPDEYRELLVRLIVREHGELETNESFMAMTKDDLDRAWVLAPDHESRRRMVHSFSEEIGHAHLFAELVRELDPGLLAWQNEVKLEAFAIPRERWVDLVYLNFLIDRVGVFQIGNWIDSSYRPLARLVPRVYKEEQGHARRGLTHLRQLCSTAAGREEAEEALQQWYPAALDMFGHEKSKTQWKYIEWGLKKEPNAVLRQRYIDEVQGLLDSVGLRPPAPDEGRKHY